MEKIADRLEELQKIAYYRSGLKILHEAEIGLVGCFIFNLSANIKYLERTPLNILMVAIFYLFLSVVGGFIFSKKVNVMLIAGLALIFAGLYAIAASFFVGAIFAASGGIAGFTSIYVLLLGRRQSFVRYRQLQLESFPPPDKKDIALLDEIVADIRKAKKADSPDFIKFIARSFLEQIWHGKLDGDIAVFNTANKESEILFLRKNEVNISKIGEVLLGKTLEVSAHLGEHKFKLCLMEPKYMERYQNWKSASH
jgi:hypothetical protein